MGKLFPTGSSAERFASVGSVEDLHRVQNGDAFSEDHFRKVSFDLSHAADVARRDDVGLG